MESDIQKQVFSLVSNIKKDLDKINQLLGLIGFLDKIYDIMKDMESRGVPLNCVNIHEACEASSIRFSMSDLKTHLDKLENSKFIKRVFQANKNRARSYKIRSV